MLLDEMQQKVEWPFEFGQLDMKIRIEWCGWLLATHTPPPRAGSIAQPTSHPRAASIGDKMIPPSVPIPGKGIRKTARRIRNEYPEMRSLKSSIERGNK
jgi:hypothetical protein